MMFMWVLIAIAVLASALLIWMEHEWGFVLGGSTAVILVISYVAAELILRTPLVVILPWSARSPIDAMAIVAGILLMLALIGIGYLAGRKSASRKLGQKP